MTTNNLLFLVVVGLIFGGLFATKIFLKMSTRKFLIGIPAIIIGLIIGSLLSLPFQRLPGDFGLWVPITVTSVSVFISIYIFFARRDGIENFFADTYKMVKPTRFDKQNEKTNNNEFVLDTSAIIDGRLLGVVETGFLNGKLILFRFVLAELQNIADSSENLRREKGKRGLEMLDKIKNKKNIKLDISSEDAEDIKAVDAKLVKLAKIKDAPILTTDFNLNKVAKIQGVEVLNLNELSEAIKPAIIPGEAVKLEIIQLGKDRTQGVGYLKDGTMIVVENGGKLVGKKIKVEITRILQTPAGKMYFSKIKNNH